MERVWLCFMGQLKAKNKRKNIKDFFFGFHSLVPKGGLQ
jgi:hypothetical protein